MFLSMVSRRAISRILPWITPRTFVMIATIFLGVGFLSVMGQRAGAENENGLGSSEPGVDSAREVKIAALTAIDYRFLTPGEVSAEELRRAHELQGLGEYDQALLFYNRAVKSAASFRDYAFAAEVLRDKGWALILQDRVNNFEEARATLRDAQAFDDMVTHATTSATTKAEVMQRFREAGIFAARLAPGDAGEAAQRYNDLIDDCTAMGNLKCVMAARVGHSLAVRNGSADMDTVLYDLGLAITFYDSTADRPRLADALAHLSLAYLALEEWDQAARYGDEAKTLWAALSGTAATSDLYSGKTAMQHRDDADLRAMMIDMLALDSRKSFLFGRQDLTPAESKQILEIREELGSLHLSPATGHGYDQFMFGFLEAETARLLPEKEAAKSSRFEVLADQATNRELQFLASYAAVRADAGSKATGDAVSLANTALTEIFPPELCSLPYLKTRYDRLGQYLKENAASTRDPETRACD